MRKIKKKKSTNKTPSIKITPVDAEHIPLNENGITYVFANIESSIQGGRTVLLSHRNSVNIDCGFSAKVPVGFELVLDLLPEFKEHGLEIFKGTLMGEGKVSLGVRNLGREIVNISHRQRIASIRVMPVYELILKIEE